uniref:Ovule protein n=1 Tax=Brugia timori TaxID=42155 RepID=A0A0R3R4C0_9BILA
LHERIAQSMGSPQYEDSLLANLRILHDLFFSNDCKWCQAVIVSFKQFTSARKWSGMLI